ncbi:MAG: hypothetical protein ACK5JS_00305 [Mangrovibacterium sp.]
MKTGNINREEMDAIRAKRLHLRQRKQMLYGALLIFLGVVWMLVELNGWSFVPVLDQVGLALSYFSMQVRELIGQFLFPMLLLLIGLAIMMYSYTKTASSWWQQIITVFVLPAATVLFSLVCVGWLIKLMSFADPYIIVCFAIPLYLVSLVDWMAEKLFPLFHALKTQHHE